MLLSRAGLPTVIVLGIYAFVVPCIVTFLQASTDALFNAVVVAITAWCCFASLSYLYHAATLQFPGPIPIPIIGNCLSLVEKGNVQESVRHLIAKYGKVVDIDLIHGNRCIMVNDPAFCKLACKSMDRGDLPLKNWTKAWRKRFLWQEIYGCEGLDLFKRTDKIMDWLGHRKFLQTAFDQKHVRAMGEKVEVVVKALVRNLPEGEIIDIIPYFQDFGLEMIHMTSLGRSVMSLEDRGRFLVDSLALMTKMFQTYMFNPFLFVTVRILPYLGLNPDELKRQKVVPQFRKYVHDIVAEEIQRQKKEGTSDGAVDNLLSLVVAGMNQNYQIGNVIDDLGAFIFAGYDTTAVTLANLMHHLASNPHVQQKLHDEIDAVDSALSYLEISKMLPFLSACIRESQRLQSVGPLLMRRLQDNIPLTLSDGRTKTVPKDTVVFIPCFLLHRDPTQYPDPEAYKPERWIDHDGTLIPPRPGYFFAFGHGPKMCVGIQLAELEIKMAAVAVLSEFRVESRGKVNFVDNFVTGPDKVEVELTRRK